MKIGSRVLLAGLLALSGAAAAPVITVAECSPLPVTDDIRDYIGVAFTATVADVTDRVDAPMADAAPFNWKVVLDVDRVYRGNVEETLHWNGWGAGCSGIRPDIFKPGQRYFISTSRLDPEGMRAPGPYTLVWKQDGDRWPFHNRVLKTAHGSKPPEARMASSLRRIRQAVGALRGGWYPPAPRQARATDALGDRPNAVEVDDRAGRGMARLDAEQQVARQPRQQQRMAPDEVVAYLRSLPTLWADSGPEGRQALASALFTKLEVEGYTKMRYALTPDAVTLGLGAALPAQTETDGHTGGCGRGERARASISDVQVIRFVEPERSGSADEMSA